MDCICDKFVMVEDGEVFEMSQAAKGDPGPGVAPGGTTGQILAKASDTDYDTEWIDAPDMDAGGVTYDPTEAYDDGTVGKELGTINSALSSLSSVTEIIDTASGAIASFPDGAGLPMRSLLAQIEPVQDLHGYDAPWAAGAGINIFDYNTFQNKLITSDGVINDSDYRLLSDIFTVTANTTYLVTYPSSGFIFAGHIEYNDSDVFQSRVLVDQTSGSTQITPTTNRIRLYFSKDPNSQTITKDDLATAMVSKGTTAPDKFYPYSNICPITGWTGLSGGVSPCVPEFARDGIQDSTGADAVNPARIRTDYLPISLLDKSVNVLKTVSDPAGDLRFRKIYFYTASKTFISNYGATQPFPVEIAETNIPENTEYFRFVAQHNDASIQFPVDVSGWKIAINANPITCTWQTEAGTVYDGYIDVVSGDLVAEVATKTFDGSSDEVISQTPLQGYSRFAIVIPDDSITWTDQSAVTGKLWSNEFKESTNIATGNGTIGIHYRANGSHQIVVGMGTLLPDDLAQFRTWLSNNPLQVVYTLAEPIHYTLTPQQISTLLGNNTVFVDTGSVSVTYQASIKGYIDKVLGA